jgi:hypothetical protein
VRLFFFTSALLAVVYVLNDRFLLTPTRFVICLSKHHHHCSLEGQYRCMGGLYSSQVYTYLYIYLLFVYLYIYIFICMYVYTNYIHMYIYIYVLKYIHLCIFIYMCIYTNYIHICTYIYIYVYIYIRLMNLSTQSAICFLESPLGVSIESPLPCCLFWESDCDLMIGICMYVYIYIYV